jgi:tryptophanyl-tRNA synthetase
MSIFPADPLKEEQPQSARPRVLSGMRPTGKLHLGNYMGALANWVKLQPDYECYFFIADWHALTTDYADPSRIKLNTIDVALDWLAAGLDPEKSTIFIQSHVPQHAELHLLFSMITPLGWLERVPTYKEQQENLKNKDLSTYGFLGYPLLQAADILLYQPQFVPVGQDQVAHVELTREVARRFNSMYKSSVFPEPDALLTPSPKLLGTDGRKMSKSYGNTIGLSEAPASVSAKVLAMSTNGQRIRQTDPGDPTLCPVGDLHRAFSSREVIEWAETGCRTATISCQSCRARAAESVLSVTGPIYERRRELESNIHHTWEMLREESRKAQKRAEQTMEPVRAILDLSHDLGEISRHYGSQATDRDKAADLSTHSDWLNLAAEERIRELRGYWKNHLVPYDLILSQEGNRTFASIERELEEPYLTAKKKRALVTAATEDPESEAASWSFQIPAKSYEIWVLLCWHKDLKLEAIVLPQKVFSQEFARAKKLVAKDGKIDVSIRTNSETDQSFLRFPTNPESGEQNVTEYRNNLEPLR